MPGNNLALVLPPGINSDVSRYMAKMSWWDGNHVRWNDDGVMQPVGGWQKIFSLTTPVASAITELFSWADNSSISYLAIGALDRVVVRNFNDGSMYDVTPDGLIVFSSNMEGFGSGAFGIGRFGLDSYHNTDGGIINKFRVGYWTFENWGENLIGIHANDSRLFMWDPNTPTTKMAEVTGAPLGHRLCIVTDERHVMLMGGFSNPRRVDWCSRENIADWTASATDSAGGWELDTTGQIISAIKVPQGILVATDIDIHLIEYVGPPQYYSRRLITDETGVVSPKGMAATPNGAIIVGNHAFWSYNGGVSKIPCTVSNDVFKKGNLNDPISCFIGINEQRQEAWFFYPNEGQTFPSRYVIFKYSPDQQWWSKGELTRSAWVNPMWSDYPIAAKGIEVYEHERGWTDDGKTRTVYAETGAFEIGEGDRTMAVSKIIHDTILPDNHVQGSPLPYNVEFKMARSPQGSETTYGPVILNSKAGYTSLRFKSRQIAMKVNETIPGDWGLGRTRLSVKSAGGR